MTLAVPLLLCLIGLALIMGRKSPLVITAGIFLVIGVYIGQTSVGDQIASGISELARLVG